jgi:hypothetical protein
MANINEQSKNDPGIPAIILWFIGENHMLEQVRGAEAPLLSSRGGLSVKEFSA